FFSSRRRHTRLVSDWSSDVCSSDLLIVLSGREDDVELVNRSLRDGGHPVRCLWVAKVDALSGALDEHEPELLCFFPDSLAAPIQIGRASCRERGEGPGAAASLKK